MDNKYSSHSLVELVHTFLTPRQQTEKITGKNLDIQDILAVARSGSTVVLSQEKTTLENIELCHQEVIKQVKKGVPIYGCNSGYGERASVIRNQGAEVDKIAQSVAMSEGIVHVDVSVGPQFSSDIIRAAMLIRINMLMQGVSGVRYQDLQLLQTFLNKHITPVVNQYGGIGASGDLAHNARVLSALRQLPQTKVTLKDGRTIPASHLKKLFNLEPMEVMPKAGLGLVNGDNFSTALATILATDTLKLLLVSFVTGALFIEAVKGTNRSFHPILAAIRPHKGQKETADIFRYLLSGSELAYQEMQGHTKRPEGIKVQDGYSLRCISQYAGVNVDKIKSILDVIEINANSVSDNPLWVPPEHTTEGEEPWQWVSGGNFLAMHMSDAMDSVRKILTHIVKLNDRHMARLVSPVHNNGLPANLSDDAAITHCSFKGVQIQSGMLEVYSSLLSIPVNTFFGVHEEGNQDITSHALTSGILGLENLRLARYAVAQHMVALAQAVDLRKGTKKLSPKTAPLYEFIREKTTYVTKERPLHGDIEEMYQTLVSDECIEHLMNTTFAE